MSRTHALALQMTWVVLLGLFALPFSGALARTEAERGVPAQQQATPHSQKTSPMPTPFPMMAPSPHIAYNTAKVEGVTIFYREAGEPSEPTVLLLHGFPSSSHMYRNLIPLLASAGFHVIAPDYPGFGNSDSPSPESFPYTFDHLAGVMEKFLVQINTTRFSLYIQDYGGPVGLRIATKHPDWVQALIVQNANAYEEGISDTFRNLLKPLWDKRSAETEAPVLKLFEREGTVFQYKTGARHPERLNPDAWNMDQAGLDRPGNKQIQLDLQANYFTNPQHYDEWHAYFRAHQPPTLIVWGQGDPLFTPEGALAYRKDLKNVELHLLDTGHFALEEDANLIADLIQRFLVRQRAAAIPT